MVPIVSLWRKPHTLGRGDNGHCIEGVLLGLATFRLMLALAGVMDWEEEDVESMMAMLTGDGSTLIGTSFDGYHVVSP